MPNPIEREALFVKHLADNMEELEENLSSLYDKRDRGFAESLCSFYRNKGFLTSKQVDWACKFWVEISGKGARPDGIEKLPVRHKPKPLPPRVVINAKIIVAFFDAAAKKLQSPKIQYIIKPPLYGCEMLMFYRTGDGSHAPQSVGVTNGLEYPNNRILAVLYRDGRNVFMPFTFDKPKLQQLIKKIAENPLEEFSKNGKEQVHCCYCNKHLTHPSSIHYGYGPVCASNWGLPWGETPAPETQLGIPYPSEQEGE